MVKSLFYKILVKINELENWRKLEISFFTENSEKNLRSFAEMFIFSLHFIDIPKKLVQSWFLGT